MTVLSPPLEARLFNRPLPQTVLNIEDKNRSNLFAWRGQFSPQLIEAILHAYCPQDAVVIDPFCGSGTVLYEAARLHLPVHGFELNPAAWILSRVYQLINKTKLEREMIIGSIGEKISAIYPSPDLFGQGKNKNISLEELKQFVHSIVSITTEDERIFFEAMVILLDIFDKDISVKLIFDHFYTLAKIVLSLPYRESVVLAQIADARRLPLQRNFVDFVITSPPYINVFNYHQNYRRSAEILGWDLLTIARSEIGSNRANRGNRFFTVVQYCLDMAIMLNELCRVCKNTAKVIIVVGHESNVLGVPFYNADLLEKLAKETNTFTLEQRQHRQFVNRFGKLIREDLLHFLPRPDGISEAEITTIAHRLAKRALTEGIPVVPDKNREALCEAITRSDSIIGIPQFEK